ncbi:MAG: rhodanese-like domain-containing protein [Magnetococcales bacterium]|nr:rhodanese-like domain-containing protein [Magnetococcales bacterium]
MICLKKVVRLVFLVGLSVLVVHPAVLMADEGEGEGAWPVRIRPALPYVDLSEIHDGKTIRLQRNQDVDHMVDFDFAYTSRKCPPFCIQPIKLSAGVETVGELEIIDYLKRLGSGDSSILVIDSRTLDWLEKGMIPGAISIPWKMLHYQHADRKKLLDIMEFQFGVSKEEGNFLNFENAKTLVLYCNGNWCGQSATNIRSLLMLGYPAHKLKWYRSGMQGWKMLGFTTVTPSGEIIQE